MAVIEPRAISARPTFPCGARRAALAALAFALATRPTPVQGAETSALSAKPGQPDASEKKFLIRPFFSLDELSLDLEADDETVSYVPNTQLALGVRLGYAGITLSASVDVDSSEDPTTHGKSEYIALQAGRAFRVAERELFVSAFLQYHEGLYIDNSDDIVAGSPPIVLPAMTVLSLGATATYYLNPEFSYDATFIEFQPRDDTVGSWTLRMSAGLMGFDNEGVPVLPEPIRPSFGEVATLNESAALYVGAMGGYSIDFRFWGRGLLAGSLLVGATAAREGHRTDFGLSRASTLAASAMFAFALGYAGDTFHAGVAASADLEGSEAGPANVEMIRTAVVLLAGVRF